MSATFATFRSADRRFLSADERGSIVSVTDSTGALLGINRYDEYGQPQSTNIGKWGYTGQAWLPEIGVWYYKARVLEPELGRFLQPDPIGYWDSPNPYAYVLNDPINLTDPAGLCTFRGWAHFVSRWGAGGYGPWEHTGNTWESSGCNDTPIGHDDGGQDGGVSGSGPATPGTPKPPQPKPSKLQQCEINWLNKILPRVGLPTAGLEDLRFTYGIAQSGFQVAPQTAIAYARPSTQAVTQGNVVFVKPGEDFAAASTPGNELRFHEILHNRQFAVLGSAGFYSIYALNWRRIESSTKAAARGLTRRFARDKPCG